MAAGTDKKIKCATTVSHLPSFTPEGFPAGMSAAEMSKRISDARAMIARNNKIMKGSTPRVLVTPRVPKAII
jgi:hypothetical protein